MGQPLGGLLGLYVVAFHGGPACMLNCELEEVSMRNTLAHELGNHRVGHGTSVDHEDQPAGRWGGASMSFVKSVLPVLRVFILVMRRG
jgi:hypothetical protein